MVCDYVLLTRKSFAAWKEFIFADFFALFASWRLAGPHFHREDAKSAKKTLRRLFYLRLRRPRRIRFRR